MRKVYIIASGGGSKAVSDILSAGGASEYFIGAEIPYSQQTFVDAVGGEIWDGKHVSERTAHQLAAAAYDKCKNGCGLILGDGVNDLMGIGVTASLCKAEKEREGRINQVYVAVKLSEFYAVTYHLVFRHKNRHMQELDCASLIRRIIIEDLHPNAPVVWGIHPREYRVHEDACTIDDNKMFIFGGSFNPFHDDHKRIIEEVRKEYGIYPTVEIGGVHLFKPGITALEYRERKHIIQQAVPGIAVRYGTEPYLIDKKAYYEPYANGRQIVFVMGADVYDNVDPEDRRHLDMLVFRRKDRDICPHPRAIVKTLPDNQQLRSTDIRAEQRKQS